MQKPITITRNEYMTAICNITNQSAIPAFVKVEVLECVLRELRPMMDAELKRDMAAYRAAVQKKPDRGDSDGRQNDS